MADGLKTKYDLEDRTMNFANRCRIFVNALPDTTANREYKKQLIRSSASQAANYIEANESLSKKDFCFRIRICRKETKETCLWLNLCEINDQVAFINNQSALIDEATQLRKIFSSILEKSL